MKKKLIATLLTAVLTLSLLGVSVLAADPEVQIAAETGRGTAVEDTTIQIPVSITDNPGLIVGRVNVEWNHAVLKLESVTYGTELGQDNGSPKEGPVVDDEPTAGIENDGSYLVSFGDYTPGDDPGLNWIEIGTLFTLNFKVLDGAAAGTYDITLSGKKDDFLNNDLVEKTVAFTNGSIELYTEIPSVNLAITPPVIGGEPQDAIEAVDSYIGTISWSDDPEEFAADTAYTATVELTAKSGYEFADEFTAKVNGVDATVTAKTATAVTITYTFDKTKAEQTITCENMTVTYGEETKNLGASAETTLSYEVTEGRDVVSVDAAGNITFLKAGDAKITITAAAEGNYAEATKEVTVKVEKAVQTITLEFNTINVNYGAESKLLPTAETTGDGAITFNVTDGDDVIAIAEGKVSFLKVGNAEITVTAAETANFKEATKTIAVSVGAVAQEITCENMTVTYGEETKNLGASAETTLSYEVTEGRDVVSVDAAGNVTFLKAGDAQITITAAAENGYAAANKTITVTVSRADYTYAMTATTQYVKVGSDLAKITVAPAAGTGVDDEDVAGTVVWYTDEECTEAATAAAFANKGEVTLYGAFAASNDNYVASKKVTAVVFTIVANGDLNCDGKVSTIDVTIFFRYLAHWDGYAERILCMDAANINGDSEVTSADATYLARHLAGWKGYNI